jgi:uncharacterized protein
VFALKIRRGGEMLKNTFCHVPGIGYKTETEIWNKGVLTWHDLAKRNFKILETGNEAFIKIFIEQSIRELDCGNIHYFRGTVPSNSLWRLFPDFRHSMAYLDIETTGFGKGGDHITTIAMYDGKNIHYYVRGQNLAKFKDDIKHYKVIVTYNGTCFDLPFIRREMGISLDQAHIDLRYLLQGLGYTGGLKGCEQKLGLDRGDLKGVDGYFAVLLWRDYRRNGNTKALETLLAYNILDVVNLEKLMVIAYNMKLKGTPFETSHKLPGPIQPENTFAPDRDTVERIRQCIYY